MRGRLASLVLVSAILLLAGACAAPPTAAPPAAAAPTQPPPTAAPPTAIPPTAVPPTAVPPTQTPPTAAPSTTTAAPAAAAVSEEEKLLRAHVEAMNRRDWNAALAPLVDQGLSYFVDGFHVTDKASLAAPMGFFEDSAGFGTTYEVTKCAPKAKAVACTVSMRNPACLKANCGLDSRNYEVTVRLKDGKMQLVSWMRDAASDAACLTWYPKFDAWASANRGAEWKKVNAPVAYFKTSKEYAEASVVICQAYLDSLK